MKFIHSQSLNIVKINNSRSPKVKPNLLGVELANVEELDSKLRFPILQPKAIYSSNKVALEGRLFVVVMQPNTTSATMDIANVPKVTEITSFLPFVKTIQVESTPF